MPLCWWGMAECFPKSWFGAGALVCAAERVASGLAESPALTGAHKAVPTGEDPSLCCGALLVPKQKTLVFSSRFPCPFPALWYFSVGSFCSGLLQLCRELIPVDLQMMSVPWYTCWPHNLRISGRPLMQPVVNHMAPFIPVLCISPCNSNKPSSKAVTVWVHCRAFLFWCYQECPPHLWYFPKLHFVFSSCFSFQMYEDKNLCLW